MGITCYPTERENATVLQTFLNQKNKRYTRKQPCPSLLVCSIKILEMEDPNHCQLNLVSLRLQALLKVETFWAQDFKVSVKNFRDMITWMSCRKVLRFKVKV